MDFQSSNPQSLSPDSQLSLDGKALDGKVVLVTRSAGQSSQFTKLLQSQGATVIELPTLEIGPPSNWNALDQAIAGLGSFDWLILTSTNGVDYFFKRLIEQGESLDSLAKLRIAVVGQKTAARLEQQGLKPDFIPPDFVADALVEHFPDSVQGLKILFPRVETGGREVLVQQFTAKGALVTEVAAYQSVCAKAISPDAIDALEKSKVDIITFASSKTVQCFHHLLTGFLPSFLSNLPAALCVASIGPQTSAACQQFLGRVDVEAEEYTLEGLTRAIARWVKDFDAQP